MKHVSHLFTLLFILLLAACEKEYPRLPYEEPRLNEQDRQAIEAYYHAMKCAEWAPPYHWDLNDMDTWGTISVALDKEANELRVVAIIVPNVRMVPDGYSIPPELGKLSCLQLFALRGDERAKGEIPKELFDCPLRKIEITGKGFTGTIPHEISKVKETLNFFKIADTSISGDIPEEITELKNLHCQPVLYDNEFTGKVPLFLRDCFFSVNLRGNKFTEMDWRFFTEDIGRIPIVRDNHLSGEIPEEVLTTERFESGWLELYYQAEGYGYDEKYFEPFLDK